MFLPGFVALKRIEDDPETDYERWLRDQKDQHSFSIQPDGFRRDGKGSPIRPGTSHVSRYGEFINLGDTGSSVQYQVGTQDAITEYTWPIIGVLAMIAFCLCFTFILRLKTMRPIQLPYKKGFQ